MTKLYKYSGKISSFSYNKTKSGSGRVDMILSDLSDPDKAPVRLEAFGAVADYINAIEWTDAEERYIRSIWHYDSNLYLHYIEVPAEEGNTPAKIITSEDGWLSDTLLVFGPQEYIETEEPESMTTEEFHRWHEWKWNHL